MAGDRSGSVCASRGVGSLAAAIAAFIGHNGKPVADVLINNQIMHLTVAKQPLWQATFGLPAEADLLKHSVLDGLARRLADTRIFPNQSGSYGTELDDATLASDTWATDKDGKEDRAAGDKKLADLYLITVCSSPTAQTKRNGVALPPDAAKSVILSAVNIIDVFLVIIAGLLAVANNPMNPFTAGNVTVIKNPGKPNMKMIVKDGKKLSSTNLAARSARAKAPRPKWRLKDGTMVYVPEIGAVKQCSRNFMAL